MRKIIEFNSDWLFEGTPVTLPHTWNAEDGTVRAYKRGTFTYEKSFPRPEGECVFLEFSGAAMSTDVTLNGTKLAHHDGGYSTFRVDLSSSLKENNTLLISVSNEVNDRVYPQRADFTFYGGLYRDVKLVIVPKEHFELIENGAPGIQVFTDISLEKKTASIHVSAKQNAKEVHFTIGNETKTALSENGIASADFTITNVHLWDGLKDPYLYTVSASLDSGDEILTRFGCRKCEIDPQKGFYLNGHSYPLHGVSRHQDREGFGNALTKEMHKEDIETILSMGANAIRLAHYQSDQYVYDLCDEMGLLVWAEIPYISIHMPNGRENTISQYTELIEQNINHPSIFCWAMSNEISLEGVTDDLLENHRILNNLAHKLDPTRFTAAANLFMLETDSPLVTLPDITGYNLYYGWYVGEMEDNDDWFDQFHQDHPDKGLALTEYGADSVIRLQSPEPEKGDYTESYQALYHEHMLKMLSERPYIWGSFVWNMFEFAAADRNDAGDAGKNHKGLVTFDRKTKKDAFYVYKAYWSEDPFVHICGRRYVHRIESTTEIKVYSNQKHIDLYVDDQLVDSKDGDKIFLFSVSISGNHSIVAKSGELCDKISIEKVDEVDKNYFKNPEKVYNWFDKKEDEETKESGIISIDSSLNDIQSIPEGAAYMNSFMGKMSGKVAGGIGAKAKIPPMMMKLIGKMSLRRLIMQSGMEIDDEMLKQIDDEIRHICNKKEVNPDTLSLPKDFLIGTATAAHQVEGNNIHSDYWAMEHMTYTSFIEPSLDAVDHYHRYEEDIQLMANVGLNAYRFSIEWARIEPEEGHFDLNEVDHYRKVIHCCKEHGLTPIVTMHHFTSPKWLIEQGGWENEKTIEYFRRYCAFIAKELGNDLSYVVTLNEANMGLQIAMITKRYMRQMLSFKKKKKESDGKAQVGINLKQMLTNMKKAKAENIALFGTKNPQTFVSQRTKKGDILVMRAHMAAKEAMKEICPDLKIGLSLSLHDVQVTKGGEKKARQGWDEEFLHYLPYIEGDDFLGIQNYTRSVYDKTGVIDPAEDAECTQMNYEFYPEALGHVLRKVHENFSGDLLVTENGVATSDDERRIEFIRRAICGVKSAIHDGVPVKSYLHWSLLDNFEWQKGFSMTFGLIGVDRKTQTRLPKPSLEFLGKQRGKHD